MLISAEQAHDATGKEVPTELSAEGADAIVLTVKHTSASFVYPVLAGPSFESSYTLPVIWEPPPLIPAASYMEDANLVVGAPEPLSGSEASASSVGEMRRKFMRARCGLDASYPTGTGRPPSWDCGNPFTGDRGEGILWHAAVRGAFLYLPGGGVRHNDAIDCAKWLDPTRSIDYDWVLNEDSECQYGPKTGDGNGGASASAGHYLRAQAHWALGHRGWCGDSCGGAPNPWIWEDKEIELHLWPSGAVQWAEP